MKRCQVCHNSNANRTLIAREMMFGMEDEFKYIECGQCGCLSLENVPKDIERYYPDHYHSLVAESPKSKDGFFTKFLRRERTKHCLYDKSQLGGLMLKLFSPPYYFQFIKKMRPELDSKILDVGCGQGRLLVDLSKDGFCNLTGIDPFIDGDVLYENGLRILKTELYELNEKFDVIILNHSFEHMTEPHRVLNKLYDLLRPGKVLLIRTPVAGSYAWRKYGVNWVQLDAPRHFFVHTVKSLKILAGKTGFQIADIVFDSTEFQFWGSEQYLRNIPLRSRNSYSENPEESVFSADQIAMYKEKASKLNHNNDGDSASFYLQKI